MKTLICLLFLVLLLNSNLSLASELNSKEKVVDKHLKSNIAFDKKVKMLVAFQSWIDSQIKTKGGKLEEKDVEPYMVYSNLLKTLNAKKLNSKNCVAMANSVLDEDLSPISEEPSPQAKKIIEWMKSLCKK
ncbi:MAG: hypothetical protein RJB66_2538 [Pseudomonadota bacterium]|jgi:hypothetical protein